MAFKIVIIFFLFFLSFSSYSQNVPKGFNYQTKVVLGNRILSNQAVSIRFSLYSDSIAGILHWQEDHNLVTDKNGIAKAIIGKGLSTTLGVIQSFDLINWESGLYYLQVSIDTSGNDYIAMGATQLFSVPYAFYSFYSKTCNNLNLEDLNGVKLDSLVAANTVKWNGSLWIPGLDNHSDTVLFSYNSPHSLSSDTAEYTLNTTILSDSVIFANSNLNTSYSVLSGNTNFCNQTIHSDTSKYAFSFGNSFWNLSGNSQGAYSYQIATTGSNNISINTNNTRKCKVDTVGNFFIGTPVNVGRLGIYENDGILISGVFGNTTINSIGVGTSFIWLPSIASFRVGGVSATTSDSLGIYSVSAGNNNQVGKYAFVSGNNCISGDYTVAIGRKSEASAYGAYPLGSGVALGDSCRSTSKRCLAIGRGNLAGLSSTVAIGNFTSSTGAVATALGTNCNANGYYSTVLGYHANSNLKQGVFVYSDASSVTSTVPSVNNQFVVRASGGTIFYTDPARTMGVTLFSGSGSWSSISDRNKKENIKSVNSEEILEMIEILEIKSWNYKSQRKSIRHIGPMAQDFHKFFKFGESDISISNIDIDGVTLSGIKALNFRIDKLSSKSISEIKALNKEIEDSSFKINELNKRIDIIEASLNK